MRDFNEIVCFTRVAQLKSISKAALVLELPKSTVSRKIGLLEKRLGVTLLARTTRAVSLTDAGKRFLEHSANALVELEQAEEEAHVGRRSLRGKLRLTAPVEFAIGPFMELMTQFSQEHPEVELDLIFTERVVDLVTEGVDIAIRIGVLEDSTLIHRGLGSLESLIVASPRYLKQRPAPTTFDDLARHVCIGFAPAGVVLPWNLRSGAARKTIRPVPKMTSNHILAVKTAVLADEGIALLPKFLVETELRDGALSVLLGDWKASGAPVQLVTPGHKFVSARVRAFSDFLFKRLRFFR